MAKRGSIHSYNVFSGMNIYFRRWERGWLRCTLMLLIAFTSFSLSGCGAIKVPMDPYVGEGFIKETLPVEAALLIAEEAGRYVYRGKPLGDPFSRPFEYPLGEALQRASVDAFSQVFKKVVLVRTLDDAKNYRVVIEPAIEDFHFRFPRYGFVGYAVSKVNVKVIVSSGGAKIWEKTVESPEQKRVIKNVDWSDFGESASAALVHTLKDIADEISRDPSIRRLAEE
jgi:hypothetical protein